MANIKFNIGFGMNQGDIGRIKSEISGINKLIQERGAESGLTKELKEAQKHAQVLEKAIDKATNNNFEKLNVRKLNDELKKSGTSLTKVYATLKDAGVDGSHAIQKLNREIRDTGVQAKQSGKLLDEMFDTFGKTIKWNIASGAINKIQGSLSQAVGFTKSLDKSLNDIRVVSGQSAGEMKVFANEANEAAKALGKTTVEYTDASLLFFQQGKTAEEVRKLSDTTLMAANITGVEVKDMADMITSALNGYSWAADDAIRVTDTLAAVGAATGSDFQELAVGMSKVASQAATVGVPFEKLNAMLATITETTREAPETIGTSLKTIFARMSEIKLTGSATDEDGVTMSLGRVQDALSLIDVSLQKTDGSMKDMATVIEEIGGKWSGLNVETKSAIANAMAGQRQASRLMALFNQWERYEYALSEAMNSTGATVEQNEIKMESLSAKLNQMRTEFERLWMNIIDSDAFKSGIDMVTNLMESINGVIESFGGMQTVALAVGGVLVNVFGKQLGGVLGDFKNKVDYVKKSVADVTGKSSETKEQKQERMTEEKTKRGLSDEEFKTYKKEKGTLDDIRLEIESNQKLANIQKERIKLQQDYAQAGREIIEIGEADREQKMLLAKKKALAEVFELEQEMEITEFSYAQTVDNLTEKETRRLGISKETLREFENIKDLREAIKAQELTDEGLFPNLDEDLKDLQALENELEDIQREIIETQNLRSKNVERTQELQGQENVQAGKVTALQEKGTGQAKLQNMVKGIGLVASAAAIAGPAIKTLMDDTASTSEKMDSAGNSAMMLGANIAMIGGPIGMAIGAFVGLGGILLKVGKNFLTYEKTVKKNEEVIERYKRRTSELTKEISDLKRQSESLTDLQREMALVGGDLNKMTTEQQEAYKQLGNEIAETTPEMIAYYDSEGNAILKANASLDSYMQKKKEALDLERKTMVANKGNFLLEYSHDIQLNEDKLKVEKEKVERLEQELESMKDAGKSGKKIKKKEEEIEASLGEVDKLEASLSNLDSNIQQNIIDPFMLSNQEISKVDDSVKQVVAATYELEDVQKVMDKYQYKWEVINGQPTKVKRSYKEMAEMTKLELEKMEKSTLNVAKALNEIKKGTGLTGEQGDFYREIYNTLAKADQATQAYIGTLSTFGLSVEGTTELIGKFAKSIDEFGISKPIGVEDILPVATKEADKEIQSTTKRIEELNTQLKVAQEEANAVADKTRQVGYGAGKTILDTPEYAEKKQNIAKIEDEIATNIKKQSEATVQKNALVDNSIAKQKELNYEYEKYLFGIASTPEGMNRVIESYNAQYEKVRQINELMTNKTTETQMVPGETSESGEIGEPVAIEVERFEDSDLGNYFFEFESKIAEMRDDLFPSLGDSLLEQNQKMTDAMQGITDEYGTMADKIKDIPTSALEGMDGLTKEIIETAKAGGDGSMAAIDQVVNSVNKQQQALGRMYATINKDSTSYFVDFKKQNVDQMRIVGMATGVMGDEYATYAEYKTALDAWMAENSAWLADEEIANAYWSAIEGIEAKRQEGILTEQIGDEMVVASDQDAAARAAASEAAAWASVAAEGKAYIQKNELIAQALESMRAGASDEIGQAAYDKAMEKLNNIKANVEIAKAIVAEAEAKLAAAGATSPKGGGSGSSGGGKGGGDFNYTPGGGNVAPRPTAPGPSAPSGPRPDSGGGGGGDKGGSDKGGSEEKEVEDLEWEEDIYHDINIQLEQKQQLLDKLKKQQDKLYGKELLDNLAKQKQALQDQQKLLERKLEMQKQDLSQQKQLLAAQGAQFNVDGTIANYNALLKQKLAYVNSLSGEAKEAAKEEFQSLVDMLQAYEDMMMNSIVETENAIQDSIDAQREIFIQEFEYEIKIQLELSEDLQDALQFLKDMSEGFESGSGDYDLTTQQLTGKLNEIKDIQAQIDKINADTSLSDKERIEMLEEQSKLLKDAVKSVKDLDKELTKIFTDTLKDGLDLTKEHLDNYKQINDELKFLEQTLKLIGEGDNYEVLDKIYEEQYDSMMGQINLLNKQNDVLKEQRAALEAAGMKGSEEWKAIDKAIQDTQKSLNSLATESLKLLQTEFKNSVDEIMSSLEEAMTGGMGFDELKKQQKEIKEERKKYLDGEEKLVEVSKLQKKLQKEIDSTSDPAKKAKLQKFMDTELKNLKEKDKLTKYDVDRANLVYDLTLKQMALEEQRATKNTMRLVRDTQGNWVYEFTEDAAAIEKAQQDVSDALEKLMVLDKKRLEETQDEMLKIQEEYYKEVQKITQDALAGKYKTEEEVQKALEEATNKYNEKMLVAQEDYEEAKQNATISSLAVILDSYRTTGIELDGLTDEQKQAMKELAEAVEGDFLGLQDAMNAILSGDPDSIENAFKNLGIEVGGTMDSIVDAIGSATDIIHDGWNTGIFDMISSVVGSGGFQEATQGAISSIMNKWQEYQDKVSDVKDATGTSLDNIKDRIENADKATDELNNATQELIDRFNNGLSAVTSWTTAFQAQREQIQALIKDMTDYIKKLDEAIAKKKEEATGVKPGGGSESGNGGGGTPPPPPPPAPAPPQPAGPAWGQNLSPGMKVRVKDGTRGYYDSYGSTPSTASLSANTSYLIDDYGIYPSRPKGVHISNSSGGDLGWVNINEVSKFDTGGYTGDWGSEGRMAMLHEKEIVLNQGDTKNILDAVRLMRESGMTELMSHFGGAMRSIRGDYTSGNSTSTSQNITINADFSGVKNSEEIEKAFENMSNMASQYAYRR